MKLIVRWLLLAAALLLVAHLSPGVSVNSFGAALVAALVLGLLNMLVRPLLVLLTLPVTVLTLGLFLFVINALMFWAAAGLLAGFHVDGFGSALIGSVIYSVASHDHRRRDRAPVRGLSCDGRAPAAGVRRAVTVARVAGSFISSRRCASSSRRRESMIEASTKSTRPRARQLLAGAQPVDRAEQVALRGMRLGLGADRAQLLAQRLGALREQRPGERRRADARATQVCSDSSHCCSAAPARGIARRGAADGGVGARHHHRARAVVAERRHGRDDLRRRRACPTASCTRSSAKSRATSGSIGYRTRRGRDRRTPARRRRAGGRGGTSREGRRARSLRRAARRAAPASPGAPRHGCRGGMRASTSCALAMKARPAKSRSSIDASAPP